MSTVTELNVEELLGVEPRKAKECVPKQKGIYFWINKRTNEIVYVGIGAGANGLYNRIVRQHLNPRYIEYRSEKHSSKDAYQLSCNLKKMVKGELKTGVDQSAFRKNIGRSLRVYPGIGTVNYIQDNLILKFCVIEDIDLLKATELHMIRRFTPIFNISGK